MRVFPNLTGTRHSSAAAKVAALAVLAVAVSVLLLGGAAEGAKKKKGGGVLTGRVMNQGREVLDDVQVTMTAVDPAGFHAAATTNKKGEFEITIPEPSGDYQVRLTKAGYAPLEGTFDLSPDERKNIDFTLVDEATGRRQEAISVYNAGANAFNAGDRATAKSKFLEAVSLDPQLPDPRLTLADIFLSEEAYAQAASHAETYLTLKPGEQKALVIAHEAYRKMGNQAKVAQLRAVLADSGFSSQLAIQIFNEGALAYQKSDWEQAEAKFREALELDSGLTQAYAALAGIYYNREAYDQLFETVDKLLQSDPENVQGRRYRYLALDANGDAEAAAALDAYIEVDPKGAVEFLYRRAELDFRAGAVAAASSALLKVLELEPEMARAYYTLGLIYASSDTAKAKEHLRKFIELAPDDPEAATAREMMSYF